ncbi:hypothetical protein T4B_11454 [Trichinella pseudospiralis]|uniref:Uncharacterized protein n=2 Tax=Trichinella pseudospiralis TaxID=6337 RepID=A0A0V1E3M0_TRIPS|nr:hypothetical protein T4A_9506 [Trichinella pseudospiralis]KRY86191.1 hypothetical protein T4D_7965 [Trichinella pseudospiralis]KRZ25849.1 hypothetical protein T4B_11454 [Trichinella pseudospiralis]KRZ37833.1 hypothetical protein T4C_9443 [Trichinella pseudospiralis]
MPKLTNSCYASSEKQASSFHACPVVTKPILNNCPLSSNTVTLSITRRAVVNSLYKQYFSHCLPVDSLHKN